MEDKINVLGRRALALCIIILGWVLCGYLVFRYTQINYNTGNISDLCKTIFGSSCDKALLSSFAWNLGYPLAGWGMVYFGLLGVLFSFRNQIIDRIIILVAALGVGASCILTDIIIRANLSCPLCLIIHFINLLSLITLCLSIRPSIPYPKQKSITATRSYFQWGVLLLSAIIIGGFSEFTVLKSSMSKAASVNLDEVAKNFYKEKAYNFPKSTSSLHLGPTEAPVQLVVFSSFQCPACKGFASALKNIHKEFGKSISITFKNFPLSSECNPLLSQDMQPRSCDAALAALAANSQNRFWNYHDQLFASNLAADEKSLTTIAKNLGLNMEKWELDRNSNEVKNQLLVDVKTAYEIGINATPTIFINGRKVTNANEKVLNFLIQNELYKDSH